MYNKKIAELAAHGDLAYLAYAIGIDAYPFTLESGPLDFRRLRYILDTLQSIGGEGVLCVVLSKNLRNLFSAIEGNISPHTIMAMFIARILYTAEGANEFPAPKPK